ncbi:hypothetical protein Tco_1273462 [Tanacetum coccineum]
MILVTKDELLGLETSFVVLDSPYDAAAKNERQRGDVANFCTMELLKNVGKLLQGCSSSHANLYLTEKEIYQLHLDEEALRETLEEQAMDAKAREEKIRQKQADDDEFFLTFGRVRIDSDYESSD